MIKFVFFFSMAIQGIGTWYFTVASVNLSAFALAAVAVADNEPVVLTTADIVPAILGAACYALAHGLQKGREQANILTVLLRSLGVFGVGFLFALGLGPWIASMVGSPRFPVTAVAGLCGFVVVDMVPLVGAALRGRLINEINKVRIPFSGGS